MIQMTVHAAKTQLSRLIEAALAGEEVVIARGKEPVVQLIPVKRERFRVGVLPVGAVGEGPDFLEPMDDESLAAWEGNT